MGEFDLIARYFNRPTRRAALGPGDDCALLAPAAGQQLAVSSDMLVEGRHFLSTVDPARLGHKALAVNLSDLAACGARPLACTLALEVFRGTLALDGERFERVRRAMERPEPRVALGLALRGVASAALDVSDGLLGDLSHLLRRSGVGATVEADAVPRSAELAAQPLEVQRLCTLSGGDDYELLFTAAPAARERVAAAARAAGVAAARIGRIEAEPGLRLVDAQQRPLERVWTSFDHFTA